MLIRPFKKQVEKEEEKKKNCTKATRERGYFKSLPLDGAIACSPIGLDTRQLGLDQDGQTVDLRNMSTTKMSNNHI